jgi:Cu/Ag efflux protein CusF
MFSVGYDHVEEWKWIMNKEETKHTSGQLISNPYGLFNIGFVDQVDYSGSHRSGWQFVYESIKYLHNDKSDLFLDMYVDRTFHWNANVNSVIGLIPYTKNWVGFVHHTFDTSFSDYNCHNLLASPEFLQSLKFCKGLFVLSDYLKKQFEEELGKIGWGNVPVYAFSHPTDTVIESFSMSRFLENKEKKLIQIGGWLRNIYTFYNLSLPKDVSFSYGFLIGDKTTSPLTVYNTSYRKVALKGKNMNNYYPSAHLTDDIHSVLVGRKSNCPGGNCSTNASQNASCNVSQNASANCCSNCSTALTLTCDSRIKNNWNKFFYEDLCNKVKSIDFIEYLDNEMYDTLLTENIVFVHLVDASAVNTVIECAVRSTPIVINKHPAVVEVLGEDYPLYFANESDNYFKITSEVKTLMSDSNKIKRAHAYLKKLNKNNLTMTYFLSNFVNILQTIHL